MKKNIIILLFTIPIVILLYSCEKRNHFTTTANGIVIDVYTRQPIDSVIVTILDNDALISDPQWYWFGYKKYYSGQKNTTYTDSNGYFSLILEDHENQPSLKAWRDDYYGFVIEDGIPNRGDLKFGGENTNLVVAGHLYLNGRLRRFRFEGIEEADSAEVCQLSYEDRNIIDRCAYLYFHRDWDFQVLKNKYFAYRIHYYRSNEWKFKTDSVFIRSLEGPTITIYY